ncbi:MAG: stage II sporulation protein M [Alistipes senegalensis]|nr:stage II sporulation protein M [Alistipes senegalensis]
MKKLIQADSGKSKFLLLLPVLTAGILTGAIYTAGHAVESPWVHQYFIPELSGNTIYEVFRNTFISLSAFTATAFVMGLSALGQPVGVLMLLYRGFGIGTAVSYVYITKGFHAVPEVLILILPECLVVSGITFLSVREQIRLSHGVFMSVISEKKHTDKEFRIYCLEFLVLTAVSFFVAVLVTLMNYIFSGLR